jgi:hypothetical protein
LRRERARGAGRGNERVAVDEGAETDGADLVDRLLQGALAVVSALLALLLAKKAFRLWEVSAEFHGEL